MLTLKDHSALINKPNDAFANMQDCRVRIENATPEIIEFFRSNENKINGKVVILESKEDDSYAASIRNSGNAALFVFSENYSYCGVPSYFSGTTNLIPLSKALIKRSLQK